MLRAALALILLLSLEAAATQIFYRSLKDVLAVGTPVIRARVLASRESIAPSEVRVEVEIDSVQILRGPVDPAKSVVHSFSTLLERTGPDGQIMRVSPIRDGSGIERELQAGQEYFFILDVSGTVLIRAEALSSEAELQQAL